MQVRDGTVSLANGSALVHGVYRLTLTGASGTITAGSALAFAPSGAAGAVVAYDALGAILYCTIAGAAQPAAGDAVTQTSPSAAATVSGVAFAPAWTTAGISPGAIFTRRRSGVTYDVASTDYPGRLTLAAPYAGASEANAEFSITTSFTPGAGIAYVEDGDVDFAAITRRAMLRIDELVTAVLGVGLSGSLSGSALRSVRVGAGENALELFRALDRDAGGTVAGALALSSTLSVAGLLTPSGGIDSEAVRLVGAPAQPGFENGWSNHGDTVSVRFPAGFWRQADGTVRLRGAVVKPGLPNGETIFTLPAGYRPARRLVIPVLDDGPALAAVQIDASGAVSKAGGSTSAGLILLDGIALRADQ